MSISTDLSHTHTPKTWPWTLRVGQQLWVSAEWSMPQSPPHTQSLDPITGVVEQHKDLGIEDSSVWGL